MKSLFFISVISLFSGTSLTATAQQSLNFKAFNYLESTSEEGFVNSPTVHFTTGIDASRVDLRMPAETEMCTPLQFKYSLILNREVEAITNSALYGFIDEWYGTRYRYGGTTKKGIDCSSLTGKLFKEVYAVELPRTAREQYAISDKISKDDLSEGDLVFFNTRGGISHVGFFLGQGYFVHASSSSGVTISHMDDPYYKKRFIAARRVCELTPITDILL